MAIASLARRLAAVSLAALAGSCATPESPSQQSARRSAEIAAANAAQAALYAGPPMALSDQVAADAAAYLSFTRELAQLRGGFESPLAVREALIQGASYDPERLSRGLVAYAAVLALQSPEFVEGVRLWVHRPADREDMIRRIVADPRYASLLPGADAAAALVIDTLEQEINALSSAGGSIESDAYTIQMASDPRRSWAVLHLYDRDARLQAVKDAGGRMAPGSPAETRRLKDAALGASRLSVVAERTRRPPHPPAVTQALALAALSALGEADPARTDRLQREGVSQRCLEIAKLNLHQCLAAARPSYEDIFCLGRHVVRDVATCARGAARPAPIITVGEVVPSAAPPRVVLAPPPPRLEVTPAPSPAPSSPPRQTTPARPLSETERLNSSPPTRPNR